MKREITLDLKSVRKNSNEEDVLDMTVISSNGGASVQRIVLPGRIVIYSESRAPKVNFTIE